MNLIHLTTAYGADELELNAECIIALRPYLNAKGRAEFTQVFTKGDVFPVRETPAQIKKLINKEEDGE